MHLVLSQREQISVLLAVITEVHYYTTEHHCLGVRFQRGRGVGDEVHWLSFR